MRAVTGSRSACGFQYRFHPQMRRIKRLAARYGLLHFYGFDDLLARYGPNVDGVLVAHPLDTALRLLGPAQNVALKSDGLHLSGYILHPAGRVSTYNFRIDRGPRESWVDSGRAVVELAPDAGMYRAALFAWLVWLAGGARDARLSALADGLAVSEALAKVDGQREKAQA